MSWHLEQGDCREVLKQWAADGVLFDSCVTDPPYDLTSIVKRFGKANAAPAKAMKSGDSRFQVLARGFMGQTWDGTGVAFDPETWCAVYDVLKPGAHLVAFGGTRTSHRMTCAIEDAGFEIRDSLCWLYGTGFPKSHDVSKGIDKAAGRLTHRSHGFNVAGQGIGLNPDRTLRSDHPDYTPYATATPEAKQWAGWGTALKPAYEPIILARKPIEGTVAGNTLAWGVGGINIDGCRVEGFGGGTRCSNRNEQGKCLGHPDRSGTAFGLTYHGAESTDDIGRWPANLIHDGSPEVLEAFAQFGESTSSNAERHNTKPAKSVAFGAEKPNVTYGHADSGTAARFFPCCPWSEDELRFFYSAKANKKDRAGSNHPTVKPISLMKWLTRLVTPPGGLILEPFAGSGSTIQAAVEQGFDCMAIEQSADYCVDIHNRMKAFANV
ncbi:MAG: DNA methyltransferase [Candidatus Levybacteria bacterium]|nr:DNA methyltransferase [Candidatus Levybacteria bacterium]